MKPSRVRVLLLAFILCFSLSSYSQLRIPSIFGNHMVLQQQSAIPFWGWANIHEKVRVSGSWDQVVFDGVCSHTDGRWAVNLNTPSAGGPYTVSIMGDHDTLVISDVMIGEVWICSGQSNMEMKLPEVEHGLSEIQSASHPDVRFYKAPKASAEYPQDYCAGEWNVSEPGAMVDFSAVGYFFAKKLSENMKVSVGMINASWGGSPIEAWMPSNLINQDENLRTRALNNDARWSPINPGSLWNAMLYPVSFYPLSGAIWYQGESNVMQYETYSRLMEMLISSWRKQWKRDFPFYYVQIAPYSYRNGRSALLREQQTRSLSIPNTGMVLTSDLTPDTTDIHPKKKMEVGNRLAAMALARHYSFACTAVNSPGPEKMEITRKGILLYFMDCPTGLKSEGKEITGFELAGTDGRYYKAFAKITSINQVLVSSKEVKQPVSVRYCFSDAALPDLFSKEGLPVNSFRMGESKE